MHKIMQIQDIKLLFTLNIIMGKISSMTMVCQGDLFVFIAKIFFSAHDFINRKLKVVNAQQNLQLLKITTR